ncbi:hypothetical protein [Methanococcoides vulcani]|nr:hypothetical protein [Methanococcoides vulcani]
MEDEKQKIFLELQSILSSYVSLLFVRIDEKNAMTSMEARQY